MTSQSPTKRQNISPKAFFENILATIKQLEAQTEELTARQIAIIEAEAERRNRLMHRVSIGYFKEVEDFVRTEDFDELLMANAQRTNRPEDDRRRFELTARAIAKGITLGEWLETDDLAAWLEKNIDK